MPPANSTAAPAPRPPNGQRHGLADEKQCGRKYQQHRADAQFEIRWIGARDKQRPTGMPANPPIDERHGQLEIDATLHIAGSVEICELTEQISTSGTASAGGST